MYNTVANEFSRCNIFSLGYMKLEFRKVARYTGQLKCAEVVKKCREMWTKNWVHSRGSHNYLYSTS